MKIVIAMLMFISFSAFAESSSSGKQKSGGPAGLDAAIQSCKSKGKPGDSAFESCMEALGFKKPSGPPPSGGQQGQGASDSN